MEILFYKDAVRSHNFLIHHKVLGVPNLIKRRGAEYKIKNPFLFH
jgi:hypothetical protein